MKWWPAAARVAVGALVGGLVMARSRDAFDAVGGPQSWVAPATIAVTTMTIGLLPQARAILPHRGAIPALLFGALAATYGCVPETDQIPQIAMLLVALTVIELIAPRPLPWLAHAAGVGVVLWAGIFGATGRESALVGALFAFWPMVLLPVLSLSIRRTGTLPIAVRWVIAATAVAATWIVARTGAIESTIDPAIRAVLLCGAASAAVTVALALTARPVRRPG